MGVSKNRILYADFSGKPAGACVAVVASGDQGRLEIAVQIVPDMSAGQGEFLGLVLALQYASTRRWRRIVVRCDNQEAVAAAQQDEITATHVLGVYHPCLQNLKGRFASVGFELVPGTTNLAHPYTQGAASAGLWAVCGEAGLEAMLSNCDKHR
jgi:hypothetical protein